RRACAPVGLTPTYGVRRIMLGVAGDRHDVDGLRLVGGHVDGKAEVAGRVAAHLAPRGAAVVAAHDVPVLLHEEHVRTRRMAGHAMYAVPDLGGRIRNLLRTEAVIDWAPGGAAVVG